MSFVVISFTARVEMMSSPGAPEHCLRALGMVRSGYLQGPVGQCQSQPGCQDAYLSTSTVKLAMIAYETGSRIEWDAKQEQILGNPAAANLLRREYRKPWVHPYRA